MKYKKVITGADGKKYEISSNVDCLENISMKTPEYISGFTVDTMYEIGNVTIKEIKDETLIWCKNETSYEHILSKHRRKKNESL